MEKNKKIDRQNYGSKGEEGINGFDSSTSYTCMKKRAATILILILFAALILFSAGGVFSVLAYTNSDIDQHSINNTDDPQQADVFKIIDDIDTVDMFAEDLNINRENTAELLDVLNLNNLDLSLINSYSIDLMPASVPSSGITISLIHNNKVYKYSDDPIIPTNHIVASELHGRKINGSYAQKRQIMDKCLRAGGSYKTAVLYTMPNLENVIDFAIKEINAPPTDSTMDFNPDSKPMFTIKRERAGKMVDEEGLYRQIYAALSQDTNAKITIKPRIVPPAITASDNVSLTKLRSRHTTTYANSNENRKHNIRLALKKVNGSVLKAGEEFSFNKTVGARSEKQGFKESMIIIGGKYENGVGGGVCQVSTTLYNAALLAGQRITSARNHSLECTYELPSFDAMVNSGSQDLRFKNTDSTSVFIRAYGDDTKAVVEFYGGEMPYTIKRHSEIIYRKDPPAYKTIVDIDYKYHEKDAESGTKKFVRYSHGEMKSTGHLLYYDKKGFLIKRVKIREDKYKSVEGLVAIAP